MSARFILDTNVIVSAVLLTRSTARSAFERARQAGTLLVSLETIEELYDVLRREAFNKYISEAQRIEFLAALVREAELIEITENIVASRDPRDDKFLSLAVSGHSHYIVTGDNDLKMLHPFRDIPILSPAEFLAIDWTT